VFLSCHSLNMKTWICLCRVCTGRMGRLRDRLVKAAGDAARESQIEGTLRHGGE
jgi:hypothetical protein